MKNNSKILFDKTTMGGTTKVVSPFINLENVYCFAFQHVAAGTTAAGSLQLFGSCDQELTEQGDGVVNWASIDTAITISTLGTALVNKDGVGYRWIKFEYTPSNGTGTFSLILNTKGN